MMNFERATDILMIVSLAGNIICLVPICSLIVSEVPGFITAFGPALPARQILLAIYISIIVCSGLLLWLRDERMVATLLFAQIVYKVLTPLTVFSFTNPVVLFNLGFALLHSITCGLIYKRFRGKTEQPANSVTPQQQEQPC
jgi:hypothetical protein